MVQVKVVRLVEANTEVPSMKGYVNLTLNKAYTVEHAWLVDDAGVRQRLLVHPAPESSGYHFFLSCQGLQCCEAFFVDIEQSSDQIIPLLP